MRVLIACEFSGVIRDAFRLRGHAAWSNDLAGLEPEGEFKKYHIRGDCREVIPAYGPWDLLIAHPPCTHLSSSGARWFMEKLVPQEESIEFFKWLLNAPLCDRIALENPVGVLSSEVRKPDQIVQPWYFGDAESKATCWWLKNLPKLKPTDVVPKEYHRQSTFWCPPSADRWKIRSRTYPGMARAIVEQWGSLRRDVMYGCAKEQIGENLWD